MHMKENLINYLYDKEYYMCLYDNYIYCFNYIELVELNSNLVVLKMPSLVIEIKGDNFLINKMCPSELLIKGIITNIGIKYE